MVSEPQHRAAIGCSAWFLEELLFLLFKRIMRIAVLLVFYHIKDSLDTGHR